METHMEVHKSLSPPPSDANSTVSLLTLVSKPQGLGRHQESLKCSQMPHVSRVEKMVKKCGL